MYWRIFHNNGEERLRDAREMDISIGPWFMESLQILMRKNHKYRAKVLGIRKVISPFGSEHEGTEYFIMKVRKNGKDHEFLFKILPKEKSFLIGVNDSIGREEAETILLDVVDGRVNEAELVI